MDELLKELYKIASGMAAEMRDAIGRQEPPVYSAILPFEKFQQKWLGRNG